jgi:hypothetical protein
MKKKTPITNSPDGPKIATSASSVGGAKLTSLTSS